MFGTDKRLEYSAKSMVRVEFYTRSFHVSGDVELNRWRVAELLNDRAHPFVLLLNAVREPLPGVAVAGSDFSRAERSMQVAKASVLFAIPHEAPEVESARKSYLSSLYTDMSQVGAIAVIPPFEVHGTLHLRRALQPRQILEDLPAEFIPMTHIEATCLLDPRLRVAADLAVVNRPAAEILAIAADSIVNAHRGFSTT
ncbi:MAG: hypothetical protein HW416_688 [Chloroflexi bacterium]|nr:hypothetical protein [Chloroflexota bacterium]